MNGTTGVTGIAKLPKFTLVSIGKHRQVSKQIPQNYEIVIDSALESPGK